MSQTRRNQARIVIIEDDTAMRSLIAEFLEMQGHEASSFGLATQALATLRQERANGRGPVDLIISDVNMPEMSGFELVERIKSESPETPVILISAFGNDRTRSVAEQAGAVAYLNKPFKLSDLKAAVSQALAG